MAANQFGKVIYLDAPATYNALRPAGELVRIASARLVGGSAAATLTLYAAPTAVANRKITVLKTANANEVDETFPEDGSLDTAPDSNDGLTAVLSGTGAEAFIYLK